MKSSVIKRQLRTACILVGAGAILAACGMTSERRGTATGGDGRGEPVASTTPYAPFMVGRSYRIQGRRYRPVENMEYDHVGMASWYGRRFHGRRTANGETFDMNLLTAAHPTLPMPTLVRVTNLSNGRSVIVRINDRGPYADNRIIDLSRAAARRIGMLRAGIARVRVTVLREESMRLRRMAEEGRPTHLIAATMVERANAGESTIVTAEESRERGERPVQVAVEIPEAGTRESASAAARRDGERVDIARAVVESEPVYVTAGTDNRARAARREPVRIIPASSTQSADGSVIRADLSSRDVPVYGPGIFVQAGAFSERSNADRAASSLSHLGQVEVSPVRVQETLYHRVRVGPVRSTEDGDRLLARVIRSGYPNARVVVVD